MKDQPYLFALVSAALAAAFVVVSSYAVGGLARAIARRLGASTRRQENVFNGYLFASPWIVGFLIFVAAPLGFSLYWSFTDYRVTNPGAPDFIGFDNYRKLLLTDVGFRSSIINTLYLAALGLPLQMSGALGLAVLLNQRMRGERVFRMAFYLPVVLGLNTAVLLCWRLMLNTGTGIINQLIRALSNTFPPAGAFVRGAIFVEELSAAFFQGLSNRSFNLMLKVWEAGLPAANRVPLWVQSPLWSKMSVVLLMVWGCGAMMLIFLAGLSNIPRELHEAAEVDGASLWQRFWRITFPLLTPYIFYNLVVGLINALQIFEPIFVLYRDSEPLIPSAQSMVYYLWQASFSHFEIGYGSAISWLIMLIILLATAIQFRLQDRWVTYDVY
jgi:multiple sugar transport system permease protein